MVGAIRALAARSFTIRGRAVSCPSQPNYRLKLGLLSVNVPSWYTRTYRKGSQSVDTKAMAIKRRAPDETLSAAKKAKPTQDEYCDTPTKKDDDDNDIWPAPFDALENARRIIRECATANSTTVICPDKDADGLSAGAILHHTLITLGLPESKIHVHLLPKGETIHSDSQRAEIAALLSSSAPDASPNHRYLFVLDQGSARSPPLAPPTTTTTLIIDHHHATSTSFPAHAEYVTACSSPPVATSSLLTYELCKPLHPALASPSHPTAWLAILGTHGDLGTSLKWRDPFPDPTPVFKAGDAPRKAINDAVALINAPRRTGTYDVRSAWEALLPAVSPGEVLNGPKSERLKAARAEVNAEVARCQAYAPKFSYDSTVAVVRIESQCQVHPVIATRWAGTLKSAKKLRFVVCANTGYLEGKVNFSCRVAKGARARVESGREGEEEEEGDGGDKENVDIIAELKAMARRHPSGTLMERLGDDFARGHVQASGGIVPAQEFEELMSVLRVGEKPPKEESPSKSKTKSPAKPVQKNTLMGYFGKSAG